MWLLLNCSSLTLISHFNYSGLVIQPYHSDLTDRWQIHSEVDHFKEIEFVQHLELVTKDTAVVCVD
jgi:hypothetical protein